MELVLEKHELLGTQIQIHLPSAAAHLFDDCFNELRRIENTYSRFLDKSLTTKINSRLGQWQHADKELIFLLEKAREFSDKTNGNFDITLKKALENIGYDKNYSFKQSANSTPFTPTKNFTENIQIDAHKGKILVNKEIEFGGLGKGYAIDKVSQLLDSEGLEHYCINAGGDIFAKRAQGEAGWDILLEHPDDPSKAIGKIELNGNSIAGSSSNRRKWGQGKLHHLLNAKTGKPAIECKAIFVLAKTGIEADAYATALFCAGFEEGIELSKKLQIEVLVISSGDKMYKSDGFNAELFG